MEAYQISAFIDDQLMLDEKIQFVQTIHTDKAFKDEALSYLHQELLLRAPAVDGIPNVAPDRRRNTWSWSWLKQWGTYGWGLATALLIVMMVQTLTPAESKTMAHRFVIYQPQVRAASLVGSFSNWQAVPMRRSGTSGYWEITMELRPGEHRYSFLLDNGHQVADPTSRVQERDDFGGVNSIITIQPNTTA